MYVCMYENEKNGPSFIRGIENESLDELKKKTRSRKIDITWKSKQQRVNEQETGTKKEK